MGAMIAPATVISRVTFCADCPEGQVRVVIEQLTESSPFRLHRLVAEDGGRWNLELALHDSSMDVRFPKTVELHVQLSRKFSIVSFVYGTDMAK